jgi:WD40 repeat protein
MALRDNDVNTLAFCADGTQLVSGGIQGISVWDVATGNLERRLPTGHSAVLAVALSPNGRTLASGSFDALVRIWDVRTWTVERTLRGSRSEVRVVAFSSDEKTLAGYAGGHRDTYLWDVLDGKLKRVLKSDEDVSAIVLACDGHRLAIATGEGGESSGGHIELWNVDSGQRERTLDGHTSPVTSLAFSPDARILATGSQDKTVKLMQTPRP